MQNVSGQLYQILLSSQRDLAPVDCFEFYAPDVVDLIPTNAERRFTSTAFVWYGWAYEQQAISRSDISRYMTEKFNSVNVTLSNVDRSVSDWLSSIDLEGYRLVIRAVSRSISDDSLVLFVGRCEKPGDVENAQVVITAKQDLGTIENELPFAKYELKCPLKFRGAECLAGQQLTDKTQAYRTASECNKSFSQCVEYGNQKAFQGFRYRAIIGSFRVNSRPSGVGAVFGSRKATKQWTSTDNVPVGQSIPLGLGRTQIDLMPVLYADTGGFLYGHFLAGEGPITQFADVRNTTAGWATTFQTKYEHLGDYGYDPDQETDSQFLGSEYYSHRAYVEATIEGNNPDTGDPAPTLAGLVLWNKISTIGTTGFDAEDWSDNPVEHVRHLLTEPRALNYQESWIDDNVCLETAQYCNEPITDTSGCEEFWYDQTQGTAGVDWKRYRSTGVLDSVYYKYQLNPIDANRPQKLGAEYNAYDPENPPEGIVPQTFYRKRYTSNWHLKEPLKVSDFIFKHLLPSFRGYLVTGADGRLQIKSERPAISSYLRNATAPGDTTIAIEDATQWQRLQLNQLYVLVGAGQDTSETRRVERIEFSSAGNSLTLTVTQGATPYAATFQGGSSSSQAWNYFTVDGAEAGVPVIVTVDGTTITGGGYDAQGNLPTNGAVAGELAARINANETLNRYIEAVWSKSNPTIVTLKSKLGFLVVDRGLTYSHSTAEKLVHVHGIFADGAFGALEQSNILKDTFRWPLGSRQTSYNQFSITYTDSTQDFQQTELRENDYDHQDRVNKVNKLEISGACVDNYHQADRLVQAARYKYRDGDFFCSFQAVGDALLLEEGDIIAVNHANMANRRNQLFRVEELKVTQDHRVSITARLYAEEQFPSAAKVRTVGLNTGTVWIAGTPPAVTGVSVSYTTIDSGRVQFDFGAFTGGQTARIEIKRGGVGDWLPVLDAVPDGLGRGAAEIPSLTVGTKIRITPISSTGVEGAPTEVTVTSPLYQWPTSYPAANGYVLSSTTGGVLSWVAQSGGGGGNAFGTIAVSGQSSVVADQANDTLTLVAGSNITLTTDATGDSVTIASTAAGVTDGDKGDISVSGSGSVWTIDASTDTTSGVTYAKMQHVSAASRLLGRGSAAGSGNVQEISLGTGLSMSGTTLSASGGREVLTADRTYWVGFLPGTAGTGAVTFSNGSATITCNGHGLLANDPVVFSTVGTLPTNFTAGTTYYVRSTNLATNTFEVSTTSGGGSSVTAGSAGSGTHYVRTGSDSNTGVGTNSRSVALLTVQKAIDLAGAIDPAIYKVTIKCARGLYVNAAWVKALKLINRLDIIGDDRYLAGVTYFNGGGAVINDNSVAVMNNLAGRGTASISWTTGGTVLTVNGRSDTVTFTVATDSVNLTSHGYSVNDRVRFATTGALPTGLAISTRYYVHSVIDANTFKLKATLTGGIIDLTGTPSGTNTCISIPDFVDDGWVANDRIVLFIPSTTGAGTFYSYTIASVTSDTITISGTTLPTASAAAGVCLTLLPNVAMNATITGGRTVGGDFYITDTTGVLLKGWHILPSTLIGGSAVAAGPNSFLSYGWNVIDYRGTTGQNGIYGNGGNVDSLGLDAIGHMPATHLGGTSAYGISAQGNSSMQLVGARYVNVPNPVAGYDRSYIAAVFSRIVSATTGFAPQRTAYIYANVSSIINTSDVADPNDRTITTSAGSANISLVDVASSTIA
jgi:hypothetical protein